MWLVFLLVCAPLAAQVTSAAVSGYVYDQSNRSVAKAVVRAERLAGGLTRETVSREDGFFTLAELEPATYRLTASAENLETVVIDSLALAVNARQRIDLHLPLKGMRQSVDISASVPAIASESSELALVLDRKRIQDLPLNRRDFLQLALLAPGVSQPVQDSQLSTRGSFAMHASGSREETNNYLVDGVDNNDAYISTFALQPPVDAIQEFKVSTNAHSALYGRNSGAQVNVITRSGANEFHGTLYEFLRNRRLDARNEFENGERRKLIRNQFGGAAGGAIKKDRTFYFVNLDALRERRGLVRDTRVPTAVERQGDFTGGPVINDPFTQRPFPGNTVPQSRINPVSRRGLDLFPAANADGPINYSGQSVLRDSLSQGNARVDHRLSDKDQLTFRYSAGSQSLFEPFTEELTDVPGFGGLVDNRGHNAMLHHSHTFGARTFHSLRLGFGSAFREVRSQNSNSDVGTEWGVTWLALRARDYGYPLFNVAGYPSAGDATQLPFQRATHTYQATEAFSLLRGAHNLQLGGEVRHLRLNGYLDYFARGSLSFSGVLSGLGLADLLLGFPSFGIQAQFDNRQRLTTTAYNFFLQDDWKVARNLTLNLGLRYELNMPPVDPEDRMAIFNPATGRVVNVGTEGFSRSGLRTDGNNLAPRLGFAWSPRRQWVVRGGYGFYYDASMLVVNSSLYFNPPYFNVRIVFPTATSLVSLTNPFASSIPAAPSPNTLSPDLTSAYAQQWNINVQREFGGANTVSLAYAGTKGTHLIRSRDLNQPRPGPGAVAARRPNPALGGIFFTESGANSSYHSLQASFDRRLVGGLSLLTTYTFAKSMDDASAFLGTKADKNFPQDSRNYKAERALSSFDVAHRWVAAFVYLVPGREWWRRNLEFRGIVQAQTGQPLTPILRFDNSNTGNSGGIFGNDRPNLLGDPRLDTRGAAAWFDTAAFSVPARFSFGTAGRNVVRGPGFACLDLALARRFVLGEGLTLLADVQTFNLTNRLNLDLPERFADEPSTFGRILSSKSPRQIQMALRLTW
ncbi:MAG: TonB-dependent receptor domain-containing protein [Bryobacteraceae bacterium]